MNILDKILDFIVGPSLNENQLELWLYLEEKIKSLNEGESLFYYMDYTPSGNLNDLIENWCKVNNKNIYYWFGGLNKSGIKIWKENNILHARTKRGYGSNWINL